MNKCPLCREKLLFYSKCFLLKDILNEEPNIIDYYSSKDSKINIINYYSRNKECPICYEKINNPVILSCGHTICNICNDKINWNEIHLITKFNNLVIDNYNNTVESLLLLKFFKKKIDYIKIKHEKELNKYQKRYKLCKYWLNGNCKYKNSNCYFAHGHNYLNTYIKKN